MALGSPNALDLADAALRDARAQLCALGDLAIVNGELMAGELRLSASSAIVDKIKKTHGFGCTIFHENVRVSTTAVAGGAVNRALGTRANEKVTQQVYRRGEKFRGLTHTIGKEWVIVYVPLRDEQGRILGMRAAFRELVDFLDALEALNFSGEAVFLHDSNGVIADVNSVACDMLGQSRTQLLNMSMQQFTRQEDGSPMAPTWLHSSGGMSAMIGLWVRSDGYSFPIEMTVRPTPRQGLAPLLTVVRDYSEQYKARAELRSVNDKLQQLNESLEAQVAERTRELRDSFALQSAVLDNLFEGVISFDAEGTILSANRSAGRILGVQADALIHARMDTLLPNWSIANELGKAIVTPYIRGDDQEVLLQIQSDRLPSTAAAIVLYNASFKDVTREHQREEHLRRVQRMDAVGKLMGGVAHDFNNLLTIILGTASVIREDVTSGANDAEELGLCADDIIHAATRGAQLTRKLLSYTDGKSATGQTSNGNDIIDGMRHMLQKTLTHRIGLKITLSPDPWCVWIHRSNFEDALLNLCINSMQSMDGAGSIEITTANVALPVGNELVLPEGDYLCVSVRDSGTGMSADVVSRIFEPYYSTKGQLGTGLGLTQVYGFVKHAGGGIQVESKLDVGSMFCLYLPRHFYPIEQSEPVAEAQDRDGTGNILLVDDESAILSMTTRVLTARGYDVFQAEDAKQALVILEDHDIHLMISDVVMPGMNGFDLATQVHQRFPSVKIQLTSGYFEQPHLHSDLHAQLKANLMPKPYQPSALLDRVKQLLGT